MPQPFFSLNRGHHFFWPEPRELSNLCALGGQQTNIALFEANRGSGFALQPLSFFKHMKILGKLGLIKIIHYSTYIIPNLNTYYSRFSTFHFHFDLSFQVYGLNKSLKIHQVRHHIFRWNAVDARTAGWNLDFLRQWSGKMKMMPWKNNIYSTPPKKNRQMPIR